MVTMTDRQPTCAERIGEQWRGRADDLRAMIEATDAFGAEDVTPEQRAAWSALGIEGETPDEISESAYDAIFSQPLDIELVRTVRILLSTGGPESAIEVTLDRDGDVSRAEYVFKDWYDGARLPIEGDDLDTVRDWFGRLVSDVDSLR